MRTTLGRRAAALAAGALVVTLGLSGCSGSPKGDPERSDPGLVVVTDAPLPHLDPQRIYSGGTMSYMTRLFYRQLVSLPSSTDPQVGGEPVPDLATDTGTMRDGGRSWSFTLKKGVSWEDGSPVTCADLRYGASRNFAADELTGGPGRYLTQRLAVKGDYPGPYRATPAQQQSFDRAISCDGRRITYRFKEPWLDFPLAIASLHMMDPYKESVDRGAESDTRIFSNGPYKVEEWDPERGGTLVRNPHYDPDTDDTLIRAALPEKVTFRFGESCEHLYRRLVADTGEARYTVSGACSAPPEQQSRLSEPGVAERYVQVESSFVSYLALNQQTLTDPLVRRALAVATDVNGWIRAGGGGEQAYTPADSVVNPVIPGYRPNPAFADRDLHGDVAAARRLLKRAGVSKPYPITYAYRQRGAADEQARALKATWEKAGFEVRLRPVTGDYYSTIQDPSFHADVMWADWSADWPSGTTVTPALFDSRQLGEHSLGQNYGRYRNPEVDALFDRARTASSERAQRTALQRADAILGRETAYVPLQITVLDWVYGSKVLHFTTTEASASYPDLGPIDIAD